jgi:hypothetical protein
LQGISGSNQVVQNISWVDKLTGGSGGTFVLHKFPVVIAKDLSAGQLVNNNIYVEMVHYRRMPKSNSHATTGSSYVEAGAFMSTWNPVWPSTFWVRDNNGTHAPGGMSLSVDRKNYFRVNSPNEVIPVYQMLNNRFHLQDVEYIDSSNTGNILSTFVPSVGFNRGGANRATSRYPYSPYYTPYYIAFRYIQAIYNTGISRWEIFSGPLSKIVKISHMHHPFSYNFEASSIYGRPVCDISVNYTQTQLQCWFETRLP